ncbi:MAG: right-handed parallel beta-helix repeat-containing protein [Methanobacterium sp.]|uniref:right-handed parallel beta-helix repeat-containing protein n=1 Tax=Methanobacterium sp. TaxID=2164 RepID=UPI003D64E844|nr:right-handed parallel beta-helix repeat-containing protein [Methanobacterium sp.]
MKKQIVMLAFAFITALVLCGAVSAVDINVLPGQTINDAVDAATDGDNIFVYDQAGSPYTYTENVVVNKPNLNIAAKGSVTVTPSDNTKPVFEIASSGAGSSITGFTLTGITSNEYDSYGRPNSHVFIDSDNCKVKGNTVIGALVPNDGVIVTTGGIDVWMGRTGNQITGNTLKDASIGICGATYNEVSGNTLTSAAANPGIAVGPLDTNYNTVKDNTISGYSTGIRVWDSTGNQIIGNKIHGEGTGISLMGNVHSLMADNIISDCSRYGILSNDEHMSYRGNTITNCNIGVYLDKTEAIFVTGNTLLNNALYGIYLRGASFSEIANNKISGSQIGILVDEYVDSFGNMFPSSDNHITDCNIFNNGDGIVFSSLFTNPSGNAVNSNRIAYNTAWALVNYSDETVDATYNWWGSNSNPSSKIYGTGPVKYDPWLILKASAPNGIYSGGFALITASLNHASDGSIPQITAPTGIKALFSTDNGIIGSPRTTINGVATSVLLFTNPWDTNVQVKIDDETVNLKLANIPLLLDLVKVKNFKKWKVHYLYFVKIIAPDGQITTKIFRGDLRGYKSRILNLGKLPRGSIIQISSFITNKNRFKRTISLVNSIIKPKWKWNFQWIYERNVGASPGRFWRNLVIRSTQISI